MRIVRSLGFALGLALAAGGAAAQTPLSPLSSSDQIRQSRPVAEVEALVFDLRREVIAEGKPTQTTDEVVTLAPTFSHVARGDEHTLEDHSLCRTLTWTGSAKTLTNMSCYAAVAFRTLEIQNRQLMAQIGAAGGLVDRTEDNYLSASDLGVQSPASKRLASRKTGEATTYSLGKTVVARTSGSAAVASPEEMKRLSRFLARNVKLHPQVRRDLAGAGRLPAAIEGDVSRMRLGEARQVVRLGNVRRMRVAYPLPAGLESTLAAEARTGSTPRAAAVRRASDVLAGKAPQPTVAAIAETMRKAVADGQGVQAMLLLMQLTQEHPESLKPGGEAAAAVDELRTAMGRLRGPQLTQFMEANRLAGDPAAAGDREAAARFLASDALKPMAFGTFRNVTYANLASARGAESWDPAIKAAMPKSRVDNYWLHIAAHPWSANAYKDAGDAYYQALETSQAWDAYDLGRAVDPQWRVGAMAAIAEREKTLRTQEPDFF